jgi:hypothetical protein
VQNDFETSNHKEMKLYSTFNVCFNKVLTTVVASSIFITAANASQLPVTSSPAHKYVIAGNLPEVASGVVYASIDASANEKSVIVKWVTAAEFNNSHFEVERSLDLKAFKTVALVLDGFTADGTGKTYQFKENAGEVKNGKTVYYRLKQFDNDGKVSYSTILVVKLNEAASSFMHISPNPLNDNLSINLNNIESGVAEIRIVSLGGQTLLSKQSIINKGTTSIQVEGLNKLTAGMYMAQLVLNGNVIESQKLVKQ